ncbi:autotransporter domain-containing protein [Castellaniella sp.]|uniref:autotransporter domain-containing protein n=1 Tax=Castellaniella sp. TaxID=1955812 RepID=UPI003C786BD9
MSIRHTAIIFACLGLPPPATAQDLPPPAQSLSAPSQALWDASPVPFSLQGDLVQASDHRTVTRPLLLEQNSGFLVEGGQTLDIQGALCAPSGSGPGLDACLSPDAPAAMPPALLLKLGDGHLALSGANSYRGNTLLLQGSLGLRSSQALGHIANTLDMAGGARLDLADGITLDQNLQAQPLAAIAPLVPGGWGVALSASGDPAATLRVEQGTATWQGRITAYVPLIKDGAGTLRLLGSGFAPDHALDLRQGGVQVGQGGIDMNQFWFGAIHARPDTVLSGTGLVLDALVAGHLRPGSPGAAGSLWFGNRLQLADSAQTRLPVGLGEPALQSLGSIRLAGELWLDPIPGQWAPNTRYGIVQADGGLDYTTIAASDPVAVTPVGISSGAGRFSRVHSPVRYLDPVLDYSPQSVGLTLRYNARGVNTADPSWRSALLDDSRFLRDSALAHTGGGRAWAQTWAANTERRGQHSLPGDDRDTGGLQLGVSRPVGRDWHVAAFAGWQDSRQRSQSSQAAGSADEHSAYHLRDRAAHLGLGAQYRGPFATLALGAAQSHHRARISRQADPAESALSSRARAVLTQLWADIRPAQPLPVGDWGITPWARAAWLRLHRPATRENGGMAAVALDAQTDQRWLTRLGILAERRWPAPQGEARLFAQAGVRSLWGGRALHSPQAYRADPGASFDAAGLPIARHTLQLDLGVHAPISRQAAVTLAYTGQHGGGQMQHGVWLGVSITLGGKSARRY